MTPLHINKIITLKKDTHKPEKAYITILIVTIFIKCIHTYKHHYNPFYTKNNYIYNQIKKHTYKSQNTWHSFFAHPLFKY